MKWEPSLWKQGGESVPGPIDREQYARCHRKGTLTSQDSTKEADPPTLTFREEAGLFSLKAQLSSVGRSCRTLFDPMDCSIPDFPVHHQVPELAQTHVHQVGDSIQPSHPLSSPFPPTFNLSQHQGLFKWVSSSHQVAKVLEFQLHHQSFQWIFRTDFL